MNSYIEHLLQLYQEKKIGREATLSLLEKYKAIGEPSNNNEPIAIVGMACRMPMADSSASFWNLLKTGTNCITSFPKDRRFDTDRLIPVLKDNLQETEDPYWVGGFLSSVDRFDNDFFHILPGEAKIMDPQQRLFLEVAHAAFEDAGYTSGVLRHSNTGVFIGDVVNEYRKIVTEVSPLAVIGNISPFIASRISYFYDLHGPTINVSTTCSTSLVAVHLACQSLRSGESDLVLTGAVNLRLFPFAFKDDPVDALGITTPDGACFAFDDRASGIVRGEGVGALVLKRLKDALRDKNHIYALIRGSVTNNDGKSSNVGAPNPLAHESLLKKAWEKSGINPRHISYIEAHGTGTKIGDPIEVQGISKAFAHFTPDRQFCGLGSVKTNIGHLTGGASGLASLIKTILALKHEMLPPSLHFQKPNSFIDFPSTPLYVVNRLQPWHKESHPRLAGVSAFGFNGANCHMVLEEAPTIVRQTSTIVKPLPFLFTHRSVEGLKRLIQDYIKFFKGEGARLKVEDVSYTLYKGRDHHLVQHLVYAITLEELCDQLAECSGFEVQSVQWDTVFSGLDPHLVSLPTYTFESKRFWLETDGWKNEDQISNSKIKTSKEATSKTALEELLAIFKETFGVETVTPSDHFFNLGGDSLLGVEILNLIHKRLQKKISYKDLFQNPVISDLASLLEGKETSLFQGIPKAPQKECYPLSYGQRRLWILHQMQDNPIAYNMYDTYQFDTAIDLRAFQNALNLLVKRHTAFRTIFFEKEGEPLQKLLTPEPFDLTIKNALSKEAALKDILEFREQPFYLDKAPLAKAMLIQLPGNRSIFFFMMHHIISDGWSIKIIIEELLKLYQGATLQSLRIDPIDYALWQHADKKSKAKYWMERFKGPLPVCEIPGDKVRPATFTFEGARTSFSIPKEWEEKLLQLGGKENATLFMVLLSSLNVLIYRYTGMTELIVGTPISGRFHADLKPLVGFFVNTLAIRSSLNPFDTFAQFLRRVRDSLTQDFEHQEYPFDLLIDQLELERDTSRSPLFNINIAFQNFELDEAASQALSKLASQRLELPHHSCKWDLEFEFVRQQDGSLICYVEYYTALYSTEMIQSIIETFKSLLGTLAQGFDQPIFSVELGAASSLVVGPVKSVPRRPIHQLFEEQAKSNPDLPAIKFGQKVVTYQELNEEANQLARSLALPHEKCVGLYLENSIESIVAILAILKAGGAYVPLDTKSPLDRIQKLIEEARIECLISSSKNLRALNILKWSTPLDHYYCLDSSNIISEVEPTGHFMDRELWDQVASEAETEISASGWVSSYSGLPFSVEEMQEYKLNILNKLDPYLHANLRVLEVGCGSGLTAFTLAPRVGYYKGVDLSGVIIEKNKERAAQAGLTHLHFECCTADAIDRLQEDDFDLIIINSVIHCFPGHNYLKQVINKSIDLLKPEGLIFLGDLMDADLKGKLIDSLREFRASHFHLGLRTKLDWDQELFVSKNFLNSLIGENGIVEIAISRKLGTLENELSLFRYDAIVKINKSESSLIKRPYQLDRRSYSQLSKENLDLGISDTQLAYVLFTSGSTGKPKGVMVEHRSVNNYIQWAKDYYQESRFAFYSSLHFDLTVTSIFVPLLSGQPLRVFTGQIDEIFSQMARHDDCSILKLTPAHLSMLSEKERVPRVDNFIVGGDTLYAAQATHLSTLYDHPISIYNEYGPTEATVGCIVHKWQAEENRGSILIGQPIDNCTIHILDSHFQPVPLGAMGEIVIEGVCLARGYLNQPELTSQKFREGPNGVKVYCTGDLGRLLPNQQISYVGRKDRQVKLKGYRIELDEIESRLLEHPSITGCVTLLRESYLYGYYVAPSPLTDEELVQFLAQKLPSYMIPQCFIHLDHMPLTGNGKIDFAMLPKQKLAQKKQNVVPETKLERALHEIWSRVLHIPQDEFGVEDDFFDLGGDSIMAMRILPQVRELGLGLSIKEIFEYRTIKTLSQKLEVRGVNQISQEEVQGSYDWAPVQRWFLDQESIHPEYFTMAYLLKVSPTIQLERLEAAFTKCLEHHDVLRTVVREGRQMVVPHKDFHFQIEEISIRKEMIVKKSTEIQGQFSLEEGPLIKACLFDLGDGEKRLFLTMHHLIIDGVSWRYLIEDLTKLYLSFLKAPLPPKTDSYKCWIESLYKWPLLGEEELSPWLTMDPDTFPRISSHPNPLIGTTQEVFIHLNLEETLLWVSNRSEFYDADPNELLLTALALSMGEVFGNQSHLIHHEGHGRKPMDKVDVSRTVGWFTTFFPLLLESQDSIVETLLSVQKNLKKFGEKDLQYGVAKYIQRHPHLQKFQPEVLFNYFGRLDRDLLFQDGEQLFADSTEEIGQTSHPNNRLPHQIEINSIIIEDRLRISIVCDPTHFEDGKLDSFVIRFKEQMMRILEEKERKTCLVR